MAEKAKRSPNEEQAAGKGFSPALPRRFRIEREQTSAPRTLPYLPWNAPPVAEKAKRSPNEEQATGKGFSPAPPRRFRIERANVRSADFAVPAVERAASGGESEAEPQ